MPWIALPSLRMTTWTEETGATATCYLLPDGRQRVFTGKYGEDVPDGELRHRGAGFACGTAQVRCEQHVLVFEQPRMDNGFAFVDVERGAGDQTLVERPGQRFFIHDRSACGVHQQGGALHAHQRLAVDQMMRVPAPRCVDRHDVRRHDQLVDRHVTARKRDTHT